MFNGYKDGVPFSERVYFTVEQGEKPQDEWLPLPSVARARAYYDHLAASGDTRGSADDPVVLPMKMDLGNGTDTFLNLLSLIAEKGKYVDVDLALCYNMPGTAFDPDRTVSTGKDRVVSLVLPDEAESIPTGDGNNPSFKNFTSLKSVSGSNIKTTGKYAFYLCGALTTVSLPAAASIGDIAFADCTALTTVSLPAAASIGGYAFVNCTALVTVSLPAAASIGERAFADCTALTTVSLPAAASIGSCAFVGCTALTTVSLPAATSVGDYAFLGCGALPTVSLPAAPSLGGSAFSACRALTTVSLPAATSIGEIAF
jgi:hypothetical protein